MCGCHCPHQVRQCPEAITGLFKRCSDMQVHPVVNVRNTQTHTHWAECEKGFAGEEGLSHRAQEIHWDRTDTIMRGSREGAERSPAPHLDALGRRLCLFQDWDGAQGGGGWKGPWGLGGCCDAAGLFGAGMMLDRLLELRSSHRDTPAGMGALKREVRAIARREPCGGGGKCWEAVLPRRHQMHEVGERDPHRGKQAQPAPL